MVSFSEAISLGFKRYLHFNGRSSRAEVWWFVLFIWVATVILIIVDMLTGTYNAVAQRGLLSGLFGLATLIPSITLGARRLHDINRSGWWQLLWLTGIGGILLMVWAIFRGDEGDNQYGPNPRQSLSQ